MTKRPLSALAIGNPTLRPEHANNYDLLYEKFLQPLGMFQAGFFFKQLTAPENHSYDSRSINIATFPPERCRQRC